MSNENPRSPWGQQGEPGQGQPGAQQPGYVYAQPPQEPKKKTGRNIGLGCGCLAVLGVVGIVIAAVASIGSSGSGSKDSNSPLTSSVNSKHPPAADVKMTSCTRDSTLGSPDAKLTITNHSSGVSDYDIHVEFVDANGTRLDDGYALETGIKPGQTAKDDAGGLKTLSGKITCKVISVDRTASLN